MRSSRHCHINATIMTRSILSHTSVPGTQNSTVSLISGPFIYVCVCFLRIFAFVVKISTTYAFGHTAEICIVVPNWHTIAQPRYFWLRITWGLSVNAIRSAAQNILCCNTHRWCWNRVLHCHQLWWPFPCFPTIETGCYLMCYLYGQKTKEYTFHSDGSIVETAHVF